MLGVFAAGTMLAVVLGFFWVVRPLLHRVHRLALAAGQVGNDLPELDLEVDDRDELGDVESRLETAHRQIIADRQALTSHLSDVAHDLRTPITSLQLALEGLVDELGDETPSPKPLVTALADAVYLEHLTDNLQLATRIRQGIPLADNDADVDLGKIMERVCSRLALLAAQRSISLESARPDDAVVVSGQEIPLERALGNLVHNAVRYGEAGGHIAVILEARDGRFTLTVLDDGPGVPPDDIPRLQKRAFRGDQARRRDVHGEGVGLAIVAEVCSRHGFALAFRAEEPRGLRVTVEGACS